MNEARLHAAVETWARLGVMGKALAIATALGTLLLIVDFAVLLPRAERQIVHCVVRGELDLRSRPRASAGRTSTLHAGTKFVLTRKEREGWVYVRTPHRGGWVRREAFERYAVRLQRK